VTHANNGPRGGRPGRGFTLVELLVVVLIVVLLSVVALRTAVPAYNSQQVTEGARILLAAIAGARDSATRANAPRGFRLIPDASTPFLASISSTTPQPLTYSKMIAIEPAADLSDQSLYGAATFPTASAVWTSTSSLPPPYHFPTAGTSNYPFPSVATGTNQVLMVVQAVYQSNDPTLQIPNPPTNWFWNVRIGDRFRFSDSGRYYTVVGPMTTINPENFVNDGVPGTTTLQDTYTTTSATVTVTPEYLFLVNGVDDNNNGFVDEGFDAVDNDLLNGVDDILEWNGERETWLGVQAPAAAHALLTTTPPKTFHYILARRPVPVPGGRESSLPSGVVIDATGWNTASPERSRLPVNPNNGFIDVLLNQSGQLVPTTEYSSPTALQMGGAFYHFWIADRTDVATPQTNLSPTLPIPAPPSSSAYPGVTLTLRKERRLVTLFAKNGQTVTNSIENFDYLNAYGINSPQVYNPSLPFLAPQLGIREAK